ncbi:uncharacterized protein A4U43_C01F3330 [Asparagus officinalis]|uniref:Uncharacterized protein n=1 Tax=Asparagus officinalis TaxID=4686 RepID=A0A5P1FQ71_ASPOF|nr:uncharacterized protein A4U43_C01F3330 [Asparagus officinalis]
MDTKNAEKGEEEEEHHNMSIWDCGSPLYDSFELASLCHHLDRHLMILPFTVAKDSDEFSGKTKIVVSSSGGGRGKKEVIEKKSKDNNGSLNLKFPLLSTDRYRHKTLTEIKPQKTSDF